MADAALGKLVVSLEANIAQFGNDMRTAQQVSKEAMEHIAESADIAKDAAKSLGLALIGLGAGFSVDALIEKFNSVVESMANLEEASVKTGASVEGMSAIETMVRVLGGSMESTTTAMEKFQKNLHATDDEAKGAGLALKAIGLSMQELRTMDTADAYEALAKALAKYADDGGKVAIIQAILGKNGAEQLPVLKDMAESGDLVARVTKAQAEEAKKYQEDLNRLKIAFDNVWMTIAKNIIPVLDDVIKAMTDSGNSAKNLKNDLDDLTKDGSIKEWAQNTAIQIAYLVDDAREVGRAFEDVSIPFRRLAKDTENLAAATTILLSKTGWNEKKQAWAELTAESQRYFASLDAEQVKLNQPLDSYAERLKKQFASPHSQAAEHADRPSLSGFVTNPNEKKAASAAADDYERLIKSIQQKIAVQEVELQLDNKATDAQRQYASFLNDLSNNRLKLTPKELSDLAVEWDKYLANADKLQERARQMAADAARHSITALGDNFAKDNALKVESMQVMSESARNLAVALRNVDERGEHVAETFRKMLSDKKIDAEQFNKLMKDLNAELGKQKGIVTDLNAAQDKLNASWEYGAQVALQHYLDEARKTATQSEKVFSDAFQGMEDGLVQFMQTGKLSFKSMADSIVADIDRMVAKKIVSGMFNGDSGSWIDIGNFFNKFGDFGGQNILGKIADMLPKFASGTDYVPHDMVAVIHKGEKIVPAAQNAANASSYTGGGGVNVVMHINTPDANSFRASAGQITAQMTRTLGHGRRFS